MPRRTRTLHYLIAGSLLLVALLYVGYGVMERRHPLQIREYLDKCECDPGVSLSIFQERLNALTTQVNNQQADIDKNTQGLATLNQKIKTTQEELDKELARGQ